MNMYQQHIESFFKCKNDDQTEKNVLFTSKQSNMSLCSRIKQTTKSFVIVNGNAKTGKTTLANQLLNKNKKNVLFVCGANVITENNTIPYHVIPNGTFDMMIFDDVSIILKSTTQTCLNTFFKNVWFSCATKNCKIVIFVDRNMTSLETIRGLVPFIPQQRRCFFEIDSVSFGLSRSICEFVTSKDVGVVQSDLTIPQQSVPTQSIVCKNDKYVLDGQFENIIKNLEHNNLCYVVVKHFRFIKNVVRQIEEMKVMAFSSYKQSMWCRHRTRVVVSTIQELYRDNPSEIDVMICLDFFDMGFFFFSNRDVKLRSDDDYFLLTRTSKIFIFQQPNRSRLQICRKRKAVDNDIRMYMKFKETKRIKISSHFSFNCQPKYRITDRCDFLGKVPNPFVGQKPFFTRMLHEYTKYVDSGNSDDSSYERIISEDEEFLRIIGCYTNPADKSALASSLFVLIENIWSKCLSNFKQPWKIIECKHICKHPFNHSIHAVGKTLTNNTGTIEWDEDKYFVQARNDRQNLITRVPLSKFRNKTIHVIGETCLTNGIKTLVIDSSKCHNDVTMMPKSQKR